MKKIGILGSGPVGQALGTGFIKHGYDVMIGTRDSKKLDDWKLKNPGASIGSFAGTAGFGDIIVLATKGSVAHMALAAAGKDHLHGKVIIDTTNPFTDQPHHNGVLSFFTDLNSSLMEKLQKQFGEAHFVKAFNTVGNGLMVDPDFGGTKPSMFICGNSAKARKTVSEILDTFGWETEDLGKAEAARVIEPMAILWCIPGLNHNEWNHVFKLLRK